MAPTRPSTTATNSSPHSTAEGRQHLAAFSFSSRRSTLLHVAVVLVAIDPARLLVLLRRQRVTILRGQVAVVLSAHATLFLVDARLLVLELRSFTGCQLSAL